MSLGVSSSMMILKATSWSFRSIMLLRPSVILIFIALILFLFLGATGDGEALLKRGS